ncbi:MAG TPA: hypothetical protein VIJ66_05950 [Solirubrobacteraceae bacterium]
MGENTEEVDALPVLAQEPTVIASPAAAAAAALPAQAGPGRAVVPAVQAAAVAAGGFVAGAAVVGLVHRRRRATLAKGRDARRLSRARPPRRDGRSANKKAGELLQIVGSRSLLVDVHLLGGER